MKELSDAEAKLIVVRMQSARVRGEQRESCRAERLRQSRRQRKREGCPTEKTEARCDWSVGARKSGRHAQVAYGQNHSVRRSKTRGG
jgi:hypothetical protein